MTHCKFRFSESAATTRQGLRTMVEELEKRFLFSCSSGDGGSNEMVESQLFSHLPADGAFPDATLSIGFGDHQQAGHSNETVVTGLSQGEETSVGVLPFDDGRYAIAWFGSHEGVFGVYVRGFNASGGPLGDPQLVHEFPFLSQSLGTPTVTIVGTADSEFAVLWKDDIGIFGQRLDCTLSPIDSPVLLVSNVSYDNAQLQAIAKHGDGAVVSWADSSGQLYAQGFDSSLNPTHSEIVLPVAPGYDSLFRLVSHPEADFVTSFHVESQTGSIQPLQQYMVDGSQVGTTLQLTNEFSGARPVHFLDDGRVASIRPVILRPNEMDVVLEIHSPTGDKLFEETVITNASLEDVPQFAAMEHGGFAVSFVRGAQPSQQLFVQQFNANGEKIGDEVLMNSGPIQSNSLLSPLAGNGFALQWIGFALNGIDSTIVTRPMHVGSTPVELNVDGIPNLGDFAEIELAGLPAEAALSHGMRNADGSWRLQYSDLESLVVLNNDPFEMLDLTLVIRDAQTLEEYAYLPGIIGTDDDDFIESQIGDHIFGGDGIDTLIVSGPRNDYVANATADGFQLVSFSTEVHPDVVEVEYVQFDDEVIAVDTLLNPPVVEPPDPPPVPPQIEEQDPPLLPPFIEESDPPLPPPIIEDPPATDPPPTPPQIGPVEEPAEEPAEETPADPETEPPQGGTEPPVVVESDSPAGEPPATIDDRGFDDILSLLISDTIPQVNVPQGDPSASRAIEALAPPVGPRSQDNPSASPPKTAADIASLRSVPLHIPLFFELNDGNELAATPPKAPNEPQQAYATAPQQNVAEAVASTVAATKQAIPQATIKPPVFVGKIDVMINSLASLDKRFASEIIGVETVFNADRLFHLMEETVEDVGLSIRSQQLLAGTAVIFAAGFSLSHVVWALRSTMLLTKMMAALPVWGGFDPLPLLSMGAAEDDETLIDIASAQTAH